MKASKDKKGSVVLIAVICFYLILPLAMTFLYSIFNKWDTIVPRGLSFNAYTTILSDITFLESIGRTIFISVIPVLICTTFVLLVMYVIVVYHPSLDKYMQILCTIPYAIQGIILAVSVLSLYADAPDPLGNRILMLIFTYCIVILPYIYQGIKNSLNGVNAIQLIEAAEMLGASRLYAFFKIVVPNILSGITVSAMLAVALIFGDFVVINIIGGSYFQTAQLYLYDILKKSGQKASAVIIVLFIVTLIISTIVFFMDKKSEKEKN